MTSLRVLGFAQVAGYLGILIWFLSGPGHLYALVSPMMDFTKMLEYLYLGFGFLLFPAFKLYLSAKELTLEQWNTARKSQDFAFIACLLLLIPGFAASAYPQLLVASIAGIAIYPITLIVTIRYKKTKISR
jgi:hypothetical protein